MQFKWNFVHKFHFVHFRFLYIWHPSFICKGYAKVQCDLHVITCNINLMKFIWHNSTNYLKFSLIKKCKENKKKEKNNSNLVILYATEEFQMKRKFHFLLHKWNTIVCVHLCMFAWLYYLHALILYCTNDWKMTLCMHKEQAMRDQTLCRMF